MSVTSLYSLKDLRFSYPFGNQNLEVLKGISLTIQKGDFICIQGPSGSGKTTLLNLLGLIEPVQLGELFFEGQNLKGLSESEKNHLRRFKIGFVFQNFHLLPVLNAYENVDYFLQRQKISKSERTKWVRESLEAVDLWEHRGKKPLEMSGGQRQRVALARAIAKNPDVIIADEPTASLDQKTGRGIMEIFTHLNQAKGVSILVSSHDPMVQEYIPQAIHLKDGLLLDKGKAKSRKEEMRWTEHVY